MILKYQHRIVLPYLNTEFKGRPFRNSKTSHLKNPWKTFYKNTREVAQSSRLCTEANSEPCQTSKMDL